MNLNDPGASPIGPIMMWRGHRFRAIGALLLAVVLLGKLLVPAGWMPVASERGITLSLCSGSGTSGSVLEAWIDASGNIHKGHKPTHNGDSKDPCPYGALSAAATTPEQIAFEQPKFPPAAVIEVAPVNTFVGRGLAAPPPPATGPPAFA